MRTGKARAVTWIIGATALAATLQLGCNVWCDPDNEYCDPPEPTERPPTAITNPLAGIQFCNLENERPGDQYWAMMAKWTGPTTGLVTHMRESTDDQPDADEDNLTRQAIQLWAVKQGGPQPEAAKAVQRATAPAGSWVRLISDEPPGPGEMTVVMHNHHDWDVASLMAMAGAVEPAEDAPECVWRMSGAYPPETPEPAARSKNYVATGTDGGTDALEPTGATVLTPLMDETATPTKDPPGGARPSLQDTEEQQTGEPKRTKPDITPEAAAGASPEPTPDLAQYGTPPTGALSAAETGGTVNLTGCYSDPTTQRPRNWIMLGEAEGIAEGRPTFGVHHETPVALEDGMCYELAAAPLGIEEWEMCGDSAYRNNCDARRANGWWKTTIPVFRYVPHTLRPVGRAWER